MLYLAMINANLVLTPYQFNTAIKDMKSPPTQLCGMQALLRRVAIRHAIDDTLRELQLFKLENAIRRSFVGLTSVHSIRGICEKSGDMSPDQPF